MKGYPLLTNKLQKGLLSRNYFNVRHPYSDLPNHFWTSELTTDNRNNPLSSIYTFEQVDGTRWVSHLSMVSDLLVEGLSLDDFSFFWKGIWFRISGLPHNLTAVLFTKVASSLFTFTNRSLL